MMRNTPKHLMSFCTASYKPSALFNRAEPIQPTCGWPHIAQGTGWLPGPLTTCPGRKITPRLATRRSECPINTSKGSDKPMNMDNNFAKTVSVEV